MDRLVAARLHLRPPAVRRPLHDRTTTALGIVHLGLGAIQRAPMTTFTQDCLDASGSGWSSLDVSLRPTVCVGSYSARADNDVAAMARELAPRVNFAHLRNVRTKPETSFHESDHLEGEADMIAVIAALLAEVRRTGRVIPLRHDHGHLLATDADRLSNSGYSYIGRLRSLAELKGVVGALDQAAA